MSKFSKYLMLLVLAITLSSMAVHKYYVAVFMMEYVPKKKVVQMISRIFIDDLEAAFVKKYKKKFNLGTATETVGANEYLKQYFAENIQVKINGKVKTITFLGKETEDDILICYYTIPAESTIKSIAVTNTVLLEQFADQQNIINTKINGNKKSLLLTNDEPGGVLEF